MGGDPAAVVRLQLGPSARGHKDITALGPEGGQPGLCVRMAQRHAVLDAGRPRALGNMAARARAAVAVPRARARRPGGPLVEVDLGGAASPACWGALVGQRDGAVRMEEALLGLFSCSHGVVFSSGANGQTAQRGASTGLVYIYIHMDAFETHWLWEVIYIRTLLTQSGDLAIDLIISGRCIRLAMHTMCLVFD